MPPYLALALITAVIWVIFFWLRKQSRGKMIMMSIAVIPFAGFDYFSQPSYWHPQTMFDIPVGLEGMVFGFSFGGIASVLNDPPKYYTYSKLNFDAGNLLALTPVLLVTIGLWLILKMNMMISLPLGLLIGAVIIASLSRELLRTVIYSGILFGLLYTSILSSWLLVFPRSQHWWNLHIYNDITFLNVPFGEVLFGFSFGAFWGATYPFLFTAKPRNKLIPVMN